jgi:hypothetical protein
MKRTTFDDRMKKKAVLRVQAGEKLEAVASDIGCSTRSLERWCSAAGVVRSEPAPDKSAPGVGADNAPPDPEAERLKRTMKAMDDAGDKSAPDVTPAELEAAKTLRQSNLGDWCVGAIEGSKGAILHLGTPLLGLNPASPEIKALTGLSEFSKSQIRLNAVELEPFIKKYLGESGGLVLVGLALLADLSFTGYAVYLLAKEAAADRKAKRVAAAEARKKAEEAKA